MNETLDTAIPPPVLVGTPRRRFSREGFFYGVRWILAGMLLGAVLIALLWFLFALLGHW